MKADMDQVTRLEIIDLRGSTNFPGRVFEALGIRLDIHVQDSGRTLKITLADHPYVTAQQVAVDMHSGLSEELEHGIRAYTPDAS